jgi:hypothetical protein
VRHQTIELDIPLHVLFDQTRDFGATFHATERRTNPLPTNNKVKRPGPDFLPGAGNADHRRNPPTHVRRLECIAHDLNVSSKILYNTDGWKINPQKGFALKYLGISWVE